MVSFGNHRSCVARSRTYHSGSYRYLRMTKRLKTNNEVWPPAIDYTLPQEDNSPEAFSRLRVMMAGRVSLWFAGVGAILLFITWWVLGHFPLPISARTAYFFRTFLICDEMLLLISLMFGMAAWRSREGRIAVAVALIFLSLVLLSNIHARLFV